MQIITVMMAISVMRNTNHVMLFLFCNKTISSQLIAMLGCWFTFYVYNDDNKLSYVSFYELYLDGVLSMNMIGLYGVHCAVYTTKAC